MGVRPNGLSVHKLARAIAASDVESFTLREACSSRHRSPMPKRALGSGAGNVHIDHERSSLAP